MIWSIKKIIYSYKIRESLLPIVLRICNFLVQGLKIIIFLSTPMLAYGLYIYYVVPYFMKIMEVRFVAFVYVYESECLLSCPVKSWHN